tara:strand:- start:229 stop:399 length:171 start_codon:yes stop_codon:yes gene_type:complete
LLCWFQVYIKNIRKDDIDGEDYPDGTTHDNEEGEGGIKLITKFMHVMTPVDVWEER